MLADRLPVTEQGVILPKSWFGDATEVIVRQENGDVRLKPVATDTAQCDSPVDESMSSERLELPAYDPNDPIWSWGSDPVDTGITDGSVNLDKYLYDDPHRLQG